MDNRALLLMKLCAAIKVGSSNAEKALEVLRRKSNRPVSVLSKPNKKGETKPLQGAILERRLEEATNDVPDEGIEELLDIIEGKAPHFTPEAGCESQLSCRETGECLGLCRVVKDETTAEQADTLAMAADAGAETIGEVLSEQAIEGHNPETPIVVQRETTAPLPVVTGETPDEGFDRMEREYEEMIGGILDAALEPPLESEPIVVRYEDRDYQVCVRDSGNVDFVSPQGSKVVHSGFIVDWQRGLRQPTVGAQAIVEGGKVVALRLLQAYTWSLNKGKGRKNPAPITESTTAPESAITPAPESAKTEETIMQQRQTETAVETYTFDTKAFEKLSAELYSAATKLSVAGFRIVNEARRREIHAAFKAVLDEAPDIQVATAAAWVQYLTGRKFDSVGEQDLRETLATFAPKILAIEGETSHTKAVWTAAWAALKGATQGGVLVSIYADAAFAATARRMLDRGAADATEDRHTNAIVGARKYLAGMWARFSWAEGSMNFTNEKLVKRLLELFPISEAEALDLAIERRKNINAPTEAPKETVVSESTPVQPIVETTNAPVEAPKPEEAPVSQPQQQPAPVVVVHVVTEEAVKAALADLNARYAAHPASDKKIKNIRNEGLGSINARIKKSEWSAALVKINEALKTVPAVPANAPVAPKAPAFESTVKGGVTVVQGVFEKPQPIIPPVAEPAPKPVIDVKPMTESTPAAPEAATQKKEATVPQPATETPKTDESVATPAPEAVTSEEKSVKNDKKDEKGPSMWSRLTAAVARFDRGIEFRCGPSKAPEGMDKILSIVAAANVGVTGGEFVSSTGTGVGIVVVRQATEVMENAILTLRMKMRADYPVEINKETLTLAQWTLLANKRPELLPILEEAKIKFEADWSRQIVAATPGIVEPALQAFYRGSEEGVNRGLVMSALVQAFHMRNPAKRDAEWKLTGNVVKTLVVGFSDSQADSVAKKVTNILNAGGAAEAKTMLAACEMAAVWGSDVPNLIRSIPEAVVATAIMNGGKTLALLGNSFDVPVEAATSFFGSVVCREFDMLIQGVENQKLAYPKQAGRLDSLAGMGEESLAGERAARIFAMAQVADTLVPEVGGPEFIRLMIQVRSAKKVEQIEKIKGGRGMVRKTTWAVYVGARWVTLAVVAVVAWAFLPAKVVFYAGKAAAYKVASLFAGKDETKKAERNAAAGEAWACCVSSAKAIVMRPVLFVKRTAISCYTKVKGWFAKSGDQQTNGTEQSANETEKKMNIFTGVLSQKFGEAKGAEFSKQSWYMKAASIAMSPFVVSWRVAKTYTTEVVVAAASAGIAIIAGASALVVGGVAVAGAAVGMAARWIGRKFFGKKDAATTTTPATDAAAQQVAA